MKSVYRLFVLSIFILVSCAKQGFPPGGPEDKTPPEVVRTIPMQGATEVDPNSSVQVWFSEPVQASSALDAVFITPYPGEGIKFQWRGSRLKIKFPKPLKPDRTYVITLGTSIRDYRNNSMDNSFTLAFSTGTILDMGEISGRIYGVNKSQGIDVWAYSIEDSLQPNPSIREPDYIIQCGAGGEFKFTHLSPGLYRLFAVNDRLSDRLYQAEEDMIGITFKDVFIFRGKHLQSDSLYFRMFKEDTTNLSLVRVFSHDANHIELRFEENVSSQNIFPKGSVYVVSAEDSIDTLSVNHVYLDPLNKQILHVLTRIQETGNKYNIILTELVDEAGNPLDPEYQIVQFVGTGEQDTVPPVLTRSIPKPGEKSVDLNSAVRLNFSEAIDSVRFIEGFSFEDTLGQEIRGAIQWSVPSEMIFIPAEQLKSITTYQIELSGMGITDIAGNPLADTLFQFVTLNRDTLSEILGDVFDSDPGGEGKIHITARKINNPEISYTQIIPDTGMYRLEGVLPGQYILECFRDQNRDEKYSFGRPFPYQPCERFIISQDTVKVRSRWPNEGNNLRLP